MQTPEQLAGNDHIFQRPNAAGQVPAAGAQIALVEGQTEVHFVLESARLKHQATTSIQGVKA